MVATAGSLTTAVEVVLHPLVLVIAIVAGVLPYTLFAYARNRHLQGPMDSAERLANDAFLLSMISMFGTVDSHTAQWFLTAQTSQPDNRPPRRAADGPWESLDSLVARGHLAPGLGQKRDTESLRSTGVTPFVTDLEWRP
ncbi:MAG TPA: hypothetical protein VJT31_13320 [Rugosimonospora sp.]|nr:hypothetical protein [Rugosimonospora sp.]